jgi:hypothetical protein
MEKMIINLKKEIKMLRDKLLSTGVIVEPCTNFNQDESLMSLDNITNIASSNN